MTDRGGRNQAFSSEPSPRNRARRDIASPIEATRPVPPASGRRLSDAERRALQERHRSRTAPASMPAPPARSAPRMPRREDRANDASRGVVALGAVLVVGLVVIAFAGGRFMGSGEDEAPPSWLAAGSAPTGVPALPLGTSRAAAAVAPDAATPAGAVAEAERAPVVCLDPGHGGPDRGFVRPATDAAPPLEEAVLVLEHAWDVEYRLEQRGFEVVLTRSIDVAVNADSGDANGDGKTIEDDLPGPAAKTHWTLDELQARIEVCNAAGADLLVSLHANGHPDATPRGYETWFTRERPFGDRSARFAALAYEELKEQLAGIGYALPPAEERGIHPDTEANVQSEHARFEHYVITGPAVPGAVVPIAMPGAIVESLFLSNDGDAAVLASPLGREAIVTAYERAILRYFEESPQ